MASDFSRLQIWSDMGLSSPMKMRDTPIDGDFHGEMIINHDFAVVPRFSGTKTQSSRIKPIAGGPGGPVGAGCSMTWPVSMALMKMPSGRLPVRNARTRLKRKKRFLEVT